MKRAWGRHRRPTPPATATPEQLADVLADVRRLRLTLTTDLSAAAGAIDEDTPSVANDILEANRGELADLVHRTRARAGAPPSPPSRSVRPPIRRRVLFALPAVPLVGVAAMTTAAALGFGHGHASVTTSNANQSAHHEVAAHAVDVATPTKTLLRLESLLSHHPRAAEVLAISDRLHRQLADLVAAAPGSPGQLTEAQRLLTVEQRLLEEHRPPGAARVLAAAASLAQQLMRETASAAPIVHSPSSRPSVTTTTTPSTHSSASTRPTPTSTRHRRHHLLSPSPASPQPTNSSVPTNPFPGPSDLSYGTF